MLVSKSESIGGVQWTKVWWISDNSRWCTAERECCTHI